MRCRVSRAVVALVVALAVPLPALAACGSALVESPCQRTCRLLMQASGHCAGSTGLASGCCEADRQSARSQVAASPSSTPGKPDLCALPANAQPDLASNASAASAARVPTHDPPLDVSRRRSVVLLI